MRHRKMWKRKCFADADVKVHVGEVKFGKRILLILHSHSLLAEHPSCSSRHKCHRSLSFLQLSHWRHHAFSPTSGVPPPRTHTDAHPGFSFEKRMLGSRRPPALLFRFVMRMRSVPTSQELPRLLLSASHLPYVPAVKMWQEKCVFSVPSYSPSAGF